MWIPLSPHCKWAEIAEAPLVIEAYDRKSSLIVAVIYSTDPSYSKLLAY